MGTHTYAASGAEGEQVLAAIGEHLPAGVMARPLVVSDGTVMDEAGAVFEVDDDAVWRVVVLAGGGVELTCWRRGREVARHVEITPRAGGPR